MLTIVIEKPMQLTIVNDVPLECSGAFCATRVENKGESATTTMPQNIKNPVRTNVELVINSNGEAIQQKQEQNNAIIASRFTPNIFEASPPMAQATPPEAMIINDNKGTFRLAVE
jgi:hypothetical protein